MRQEVQQELQTQLADKRVALVHEWLSSFAGSEQTFFAMASLIPHAELFAVSHNPERSFDFAPRRVEVSFLNRQASDGGKAALLPLMPLAMRNLSRHREFDLVITSSHAFSRAFARADVPLHLSYTYTPARYLWAPDLERHRSRLPVPGAARAPLRWLDRRLADGVDHFAGISNEIRDRIRNHYERDASVVYPPVDTDFFTPPADGYRRSGALAVSRLVPYKRMDLVIEACALAGVPLKIIGSGPDLDRLQQLASGLKADVNFMGSVTRENLRDEYRSASVVVFPAIEDFGIVPVEAQACGAAVVALNQGGSRETVRGTSSSLVDSADANAFAEAILRTLDEREDPLLWRSHAERFSRDAFDEAFSRWVLDCVQGS